MRHLGLLVVLAIAGMSAAARSDRLFLSTRSLTAPISWGWCGVPQTAIPGAQPAGINYVKVAESHRPLSEIIEGGSQERYVPRAPRFK